MSTTLHFSSESENGWDRYSVLMPRLYGPSRGVRACKVAIAVGSLLLMGWIFWYLDIGPVRIIRGIGDLGWMLPMLFPPTHGGWFADFAHGLGETLAMAFLGTLFGAILAMPIGFLAAKTIVQNGLVRGIVRRAIDFIRGINILIWALMFVHVVGLGPFAGIMAITIADAATLAKLYSETIENVDRKQIEGVRSTGASRVQIVRYGFLPQVVPIMLSNILYFFESNVRSASVLGVLGAGGLGMQLHDRIRIMDWQQVSFIVIMILITVAIVDAISRSLRQRIIANPEYRP
ncbi:MAG: phosphonate ABC transporter, permease protein PhnE [Spirochaetota bacterium]